jgi:hypothetical protein
MRVFLLVLILLFGIGGAAGSALVGTVWLIDTPTYKKDLEKSQKALDAIRTNPALVRLLVGKDVSEQDIRDEARAIELQIKGMPFAFAGAVIGLLGCILAYKGRGLSGGVLLMMVGAGPLALNVKAAAFTGAMVLAGLLALFRRPKEQPQPTAA